MRKFYWDAMFVRALIVVADLTHAPHVNLCVMADLHFHGRTR
jgi:hypothetical protein